MADRTLCCIGLDAGGTGTTLRAGGAAGAATLCLSGGAANLQRQGLDATAAVLAGLAERALAAAPSPAAAYVCAGVAGADAPDDRRRLARAVYERLAPAGSLTVCVVPDGVAALEAALGEASGAVLVLGTGSVWLARTRTGTLVRVGGWGYLLGDEGSGHALGRAGLQRLTVALDGGPESPLAARIRAAFGITDKADLVRRVYREAWPVQQVAPLVLAAAADGDAEARALLDEAVAALLSRFDLLVARAGEVVSPDLVLMGGLARSVVYRARIEDALRVAYPAWRLREPVHADPAEGALALARRAAAGTFPSIPSPACHGAPLH